MYSRSSLPVVVPAGRLMDRVGRAPVLALGHVAGAGPFPIGAGRCMTFIPGTALLADATSFPERGSLFGTNDAAVAVVGGFGVIPAGVAFPTWGVAGLATLGVPCALASVVVGLTLRRPSENATPMPAVDPDP